jgi:anti-anti-sigma factor
MADAGFSIEMLGSVPVVATPAEIDVSNAALLRLVLLRAGANAHGMFVVDMSRTRFCDTAGLHALVRAHKRALGEGGRVVLVITNPAVLRILKITGLDRVIPVVPSLDQALGRTLVPPADVTPVLDLAFDSNTLHVLRAEVRARARQAGLPEARAQDVVLAVHELAANAVQHGAGTGRLRIWAAGGALQCEVGDGDLQSSVAPVNSFPDRPGHGLWVVRQIADRMRVLSGALGTSATVTFDLPGDNPRRGPRLRTTPPRAGG